MTEERDDEVTDTTHPLYDRTKDPTSRYYLEDEMDTEQKPDPSSEDTYKVGPGFPPNESKWKPGCRSPNQKGRPKKIPSMEPEIKKIFEEALNEKIHVTKADKKIIMTRLAMGFEQLAIQWAKGDRYARRDVLAYAAKLGVDLQPKVIAEALGINHQALVEAAVQRRLQQPSLERVPEDHVKAPPDLIDDDVNTPNAMTSVSPQQEKPAKKPIEPERDQYGEPKPAKNVSSIEYIRAERERNLAQQKKNQGQS